MIMFDARNLKKTVWALAALYSKADVLVTHVVYRATDEKTEARLASLLRRMAKYNNDQRLIKKVLNISIQL